MATRRLTAARRGPNIAPYTARMRPDLEKRKKRPSFEGPLHYTAFWQPLITQRPHHRLSPFLDDHA
jgi:hypothetical protein